MLKVAGFTFFSRAVSAIITFAIVIAISRNLGAAERGVCSLYLLIVTLSAVVSDIAGGSTTAFLLKKIKPLFLHRLQLAWSILPSIVVPFLFFAFKAISIFEFLFLIVGCWIQSAFQIQQHLFLGLQKFVIFNVFQILAPAFTLLVFLLLVGFYPNRFSYLSANIISWFSMFFIGYWLVLFRYRNLNDHQKINGVQVREIFLTGGTNQLGHTVSLLNGRLLFFILPAIQLGVWSNTLNLAEGVFLIAGSLGQVIYSLFSAKEFRAAENESLFRKAFFVNIVLTFGCALLLVLLPDTLWTAIFGNGFSGIQNMLKFLFPGLIAQGIYLLASYRLSAQGLFSKNLYALLWGAGVNIISTLYLWYSGKYSLESGAICLTMSWIASAVVSIIFLKIYIPGVFKFESA
jgi:O-antigen/teichoic acid export membrane protein